MRAWGSNQGPYAHDIALLTIRPDGASLTQAVDAAWDPEMSSASPVVLKFGPAFGVWLGWCGARRCTWTLAGTAVAGWACLGWATWKMQGEMGRIVKKGALNTASAA